MLRRAAVALFIASVCCALRAGDQTPVYKLLYSPPTGTSGGQPFAILEVEPGVFYSAGYYENSGVGGSIFSVTATGAYKQVYVFPGNTLLNTLVQGANGLLYGSATISTGHPSFFYYSVSPSGQNPKQYPMPAGWESGLFTIVAPPGEFYDVIGTTTGNPLGIPAFARISETGKVTILYQFSASDGYPDPVYGLVCGSDGNVYGIATQQPLGEGAGFLYRSSPSGVFTPFPIPSVSLASGYTEALVAGTDGNLYAPYVLGGVNNTGQIYQATLSGQFSTVASFPAMRGCNYGCGPGTLLQASDGNFYGTTNNSNRIFRYNPSTGQLSMVYQLTGSQGLCACQLIEGMDGKLYFVTTRGGNSPGIGAIFSLDVGLPKPEPVVSGLYPASGPVGQSVILWGNYLLGAKSVTFNGTPATSFRATSVHSVQVTVPLGATTGPVTIATANGSYTTINSFTVQ